MRSLMVSVLLTLALYVGCCGPQRPAPLDYADALNLKNVPVAAKDWSASHFSDQGAWFGFALPDSGQCLGGFTGPFLHTTGRWLGPEVIGLRLAHSESGEVLDWTTAESVQQALPGRLHQHYRFKALSVTLDLVFLSNRSAMVRVVLNSDIPMSLWLSWTGRTFDAVCPESGEEHGWVINLQGADQARFTLPALMPYSYQQTEGGQGYRIDLSDAVVLKPNQPWTTAAGFSLTFDPAERPAVSERLGAALHQSTDAVEASDTRWTGYLEKVLTPDSPFAGEAGYARVAVKSLMTLVNNWKCARGDLFHDGFFPSASVWYFNGFWGWDTWKIAAAWARFAPAVAQDGIRALFDYQNDAGMMADVIYADKSENNWRDTKPPLAAWAVWSVYENDGDTAFLQEMWPKLNAFHQWWYTHRDHNGNGLCEYGSTDGTVIAAKWESGMDDGLRYDATAMLKNSNSAWSMDQESVDLNSYLCMDKDYLARIAAALDLHSEAVQFRAEASALRERIRGHFWDEEDGFFYDVRLKDHSFVKVKGPEGWIPLTWKIATEAQAARVRTHMIDASQFATFIPFPTIPADHEKFMTGYWRGPVWIDQAGFAVRALHNYGFAVDAERMARQLFERPDGLFNSDGPIHENYDPRDGSRMKAPHFSWSAAHYLLMYWGW